MPKYYLNDDGIVYLWSKLENKIQDNLIYYSKTTAQWNTDITTISKKDVLYIYTDYKIIEQDGKEYLLPGLKIGDGTSYLVDLPFINDGDNSVFNNMLLNHMNDNTIHITENERIFWNNKLNYESQLINETLVLNRY